MTIRTYRHFALVADEKGGEYVCVDADHARFVLAVKFGEYIDCYATRMLDVALRHDETITLAELRIRGREFKREMTRDCIGVEEE